MSSTDSSLHLDVLTNHIDFVFFLYLREDGTPGYGRRQRGATAATAQIKWAAPFSAAGKIYRGG